MFHLEENNSFFANSIDIEDRNYNGDDYNGNGNEESDICITVDSTYHLFTRFRLIAGLFSLICTLHLSFYT